MFRVMGREITQKICHRFGLIFNRDKTETPLRRPSVVEPFEWKLPTEAELIQICETEMPKTFEDLVVRRLSVPTRRIWSEKTSKSFDEYFEQHSSILKNYIMITTHIIENFK